MKAMVNTHKLKGMTAAGWLIVMGIVLFFVFLVIKLAPAYMEYYSVKNSMESVAEMNLKNPKINEVRKQLGGRFTVNSVTSLKADDAVLVDGERGKAIYIKYEKRISLAGNISALLDFEHQVELNQQQ